MSLYERGPNADVRSMPREHSPAAIASRVAVGPRALYLVEQLCAALGLLAALSTPASEGALDAIAELTRAFSGRVWLVSKCGPRIQQLTRRWLQRQSFYERTGVRQDHVRFCLKRPQKRDHCAAIGATHFVDDRLDVLEHLAGLVPRLYWFGHQTRTAGAPAWAQPVRDWSEARRLMLNQL